MIVPVIRAAKLCATLPLYSTCFESVMRGLFQARSVIHLPRESEETSASRIAGKPGDPTQDSAGHPQAPYKIEMR